MNKIIKDELDLLSKPGDTIYETLEYLQMSQAELALRMGKTPSKINDLITGKEPITINTAMQLEKVLGISTQFWLNRESIYREKLARLEQEEFLEECIGWLKNQPVAELRKLGHLKADKISTAMVDECLQFYGVSNPTQWETIYVSQYATTSFRKNDNYTQKLSSMAAWLRIGEIEIRKYNLKAYDKELFKVNLTNIRRLVKDHPEDFAEELQRLCMEAGVGLIYSASISKAPISGAVRWIGNNPVIQLTDRYKLNDLFWFAFFHEAGHVLLHGKKNIFIENFTDYKADVNKEKEADEFANKWLLPVDVTKEFTNGIDENEIKKVARKYSTHPAIVLGRLQYLKIVPYSFAITLKAKIDLSRLINKM